MKKLKLQLKKDKRVLNYRIYKKKLKSISIGSRGRIIGGPYNPVTSKEKIGGKLQIEWKNGRVSFINITSAGLENPEKLIENAHSLQIKDQYRKQFVKPWENKSVRDQYSEETVKVLMEDQEYLSSQARKLMDIEKQFEVKKHDLEVECSLVRSEVINSKGLSLCEKFTRFEISSAWDSKVGFWIQNRKPIDIKDFEDRLVFIEKLFTATKRGISEQVSKRKKLRVIIDPYQTWRFFDHFIFSNLDGQSVANELSRFKEKDFTERRKVLPDWFDLEVKPNKKLTPGAASFTSEGVKTKQVNFIENGKLNLPILDLKHAKKMDMRPTVDISSPYTTNYCSNGMVEKMTMEKLISQTEEGIYIPFFLGMHTQNSLTGDYSLPSPQSIYIKDGKMLGSVKAMVIGNIFDDLEGDIKFANDGIFPLGGICYTSKVAFE